MQWPKYKFVKINGEKVQWLQVRSGIRSVLKPLIFLIYINDLSDNVKSTVYMFITAKYTGKLNLETHGILQRDLKNLNMGQTDGF